MKIGYCYDGDFVTDSCLLPKITGNTLLYEGQINPSDTIQSLSSSRLRYAKTGKWHNKAKQFHETATTLSRQISVPNEVAAQDNRAVMTAASASNTSKRLIAFLSILFSTLSYDRAGKLTAMFLASLSNEVMKILISSTSLGEQSRNLFDGLC